MQSKMFLFAVAALAPLAANAQNKTYTVRQGDTVSEIASRLKVRSAELIAANALLNSHVLQPGMVLRIPARKPEATPLAAPKGASYYTVRNGDFAWSLARRNQVTMAQLKAMNPGVDLETLRPGTRIALPALSARVVVATPTAPTAKAPVSAATRAYKVKSGEFDWIIAKRAGVSLSSLYAANPGVDLEKLQIGQTIRIPGGSVQAGTNHVASAKPKVQRIGTTYAIVAESGSTIRRTPSTTGGKVAVVESGTRVKVLDREGDWYKLKFPKGTVGWMRGDLLNPVSASSIAKERGATRVASAKKARTAAKKPVHKAPTRVARAGRMSSRPIAIASTNSAVKVALSQLGKRYRWGSTSPSRGGFDCSGLVTYAYKSVGVSLPRTSRAMSAHGQKVSKSNLKAGDLVFFRTGRGTRVSHVAMYIGDGKIVHSSSGQGGVRVDTINSGYYARRMVGARRVASPSKTAKSKPAAPAKPSKPAAPKADVGAE